MHTHTQRSSDCAMCSWTRLRRDWTDLVLAALCYLAAEVGGECGEGGGGGRGGRRERDGEGGRGLVGGLHVRSLKGMYNCHVYA